MYGEEDRKKKGDRKGWQEWHQRWREAEEKL